MPLPEPTAPHRKTPISVLLVEDDPDHAELIIRSLEDHPIRSEIRHLSDGESALDFLFRRGAYRAETGPRPHMVLLDLRLPRVDGLEVLREIRSSKELDGMPVVVLSTSDAETDVGRAYSHCANSYLVKPFDFDTFTTLMGNVGFYWLGWNQYPRRGSGARDSEPS